MRTLRGRLFGVTLAALALTLALTIAIGATLTRRQVDRAQASALALRADDLASQRRHNVSYQNQNRISAKVRIIIDARARLADYVPNVNRDSNGETTYDGKANLYSYRTLPHRGLLMLRPRSSAAWRPFLGDLLLAGARRRGAGRAPVLPRRPLDRAADPAHRRRDARTRRRRAP